MNPNQVKREKISPNNIQNQAMKNMKNNNVNGIHPNGIIFFSKKLFYKNKTILYKLFLTIK